MKIFNHVKFSERFNTLDHIPLKDRELYELVKFCKASNLSDGYFHELKWIKIQMDQWIAVQKMKGVNMRSFTPLITSKHFDLTRHASLGLHQSKESIENRDLTNLDIIKRIKNLIQKITLLKSMKKHKLCFATKTARVKSSRKYVRKIIHFIPPVCFRPPNHHVANRDVAGHSDTAVRTTSQHSSGTSIKCSRSKSTTTRRYNLRSLPLKSTSTLIQTHRCRKRTTRTYNRVKKEENEQSKHVRSIPTFNKF